jgi:type I restriction enzyme S subunit
MIEYRMEQLFDLQMGKTPARKESSYWIDGKHDWISIRDLSNSSKYITETKEKLSDLAIQKTGIKKIPKDTVVMSFKLSIGKVAITSKDMYSNEAIMAFHDRKVVEIIPEYLYYLLLGNNWDEGSNKAVMGITLNKATLSKIKLKIHDAIEQQKIIQVLDILDKQIENKKSQLNEYDQLIKSRFVEMFGDPIKNDKNWKQVKLKKLALKITSGNTPKGGSQVYVDDGILFFRSQNVWKNRIEIDDIAYIDEETHRKMSRSSLKHKDILITKTGRINTENSSLGRAAMYLGEDDKANINGHVYMIRLNETVSKEFLLFIITTIEYRDYIRSVCVGGIDKRQLNKEHIEDFPIILPPRNLQDDFVKIVNQVDKLKFAVQKSLDETQVLFDSLMQEYFG